MLTLSEARDSLRQYVKPPSASNAVVDSHLNQVAERFITSGKWKGTLVTVILAVYDGQVTLPYSLETILGVDYGSSAKRVFPQWYQFVENGPGLLQSANLNHGIVDLGLGFPTFRDIPAGEHREIVASSLATEEGGAELRVVCNDAAGDPVYTLDGAGRATLGLTVRINDDSDGDDIVSRIVSVHKPVTQGPVTLSAQVVATGEETVLAVYDPGETTPNYRRYQVSDETCDQPITALCKRAFVKARRDDDLLIPGNMGALKLGLMALNYENSNDRDRAAEYWADCYGILNRETKEFLGPNAGSIQIQSKAWGGSEISSFY